MTKHTDAAYALGEISTIIGSLKNVKNILNMDYNSLIKIMHDLTGRHSQQ